MRPTLRLMLFALVYSSLIFLTQEPIAHDKGKPAARLGRKAVNLSSLFAGKIVWLPKAIEEQPNRILQAPSS